MKQLLYGLLSGLLLAGALVGCEPREDIVTTDPGAQLSTSAEPDTLTKTNRPTVWFDTVFVRRGSVTKRLWVYNRNARAVKVDEIALVGAEAGPSAFSLTIDGRPGPALRNFELRGRDSVLVLARVLIDPSDRDTTFLVQDSIRLRANGGTSYVQLRAFGENARYYTAGPDSVAVVACDETWTPGLPIVLLRSTLVDSACTLTVAPGTSVYVAPGVSLIVKGRLVAGALGEGNKPVRFRGLRRESYYADVPGQWGAIAFAPSLGGLGTAENVLANCDIRNAVIGVQISNPYQRPGFRLRVEGSIIRNAFTAGVLGICAGTGDGLVSLLNTVITNVGQYAVGAGGGGAFRLAYCTVAPNGPSSFQREDAALTFNDAIEIGDQVRVAPIRLLVENTIVWSGAADFDTGGLRNEVQILHQGNVPDSTLTFRNSLLQTTNARFNTDGATYGENRSGTLILNQDPRYQRLVPNGDSPGIDLSLEENSAALNIGRPLTDLPRDLLNKPRSTTTPDAGAYERE